MDVNLSSVAAKHYHADQRNQFTTCSRVVYVAVLLKLYHWLISYTV